MFCAPRMIFSAVPFYTRTSLVPSVLMTKRVVRRAAAEVTFDLIQAVTEFTTIKGQVDQLTKRLTTRKKQLAAHVEENGEADDKGHIWFNLPEVINGLKGLKRERRVSQSFNEEVAEETLREKGLYDRCYEQVPVINQDEVLAAHYEGLITEAELDAMFPKSITYAFVPVKA